MPLDPDDFSAAHETAKRVAKLITPEDFAGFCKVAIFIVLPIIVLLTLAGAIVWNVF